MHERELIFSIFLIFAGAAVLSTLAMYTRQSMLVAYMALGVVLGPWCLGWAGDAQFVQSIGHIGIVFLLFLLGLHLPPQKLVHMFRKLWWVSVLSSLVFLGLGFLVAKLAGFTTVASLIIGAAMMFSSTIIGVKLLPTTVLHHQHTGEVMIGLLLLQDIVAIAVLLLMHSASHGGAMWDDVRLILVGLPVMLLVAYGFERWVLRKLFCRFSKIREYTFLLAIAWCLTMAEVGVYFGLSAEIGAFVAGVTLAASPISMYIAESLKPLRDFFLVMFFFSVGANFDLSYLKVVIIPALVLALVYMIVKPVIFRFLLTKSGEDKPASWEVGFRLGQLSEFSLIIAYVGLETHLLTNRAAYTIEAATILTFIAASYFVVCRYPTPLATSDRLRRD